MPVERSGAVKAKPKRTAWTVRNLVRGGPCERRQRRANHSRTLADRCIERRRSDAAPKFCGCPLLPLRGGLCLVGSGARFPAPEKSSTTLGEALTKAAPHFNDPDDDDDGDGGENRVRRTKENKSNMAGAPFVFASPGWTWK